MKSESIRRAVKNTEDVSSPRGFTVSDKAGDFKVKAPNGPSRPAGREGTIVVRTAADLYRWQPEFKPASELKTEDDKHPIWDTDKEEKVVLRPTIFPPVWDGQAPPYTSTIVGLNQEHETKPEEAPTPNLRLREKETDPNAKLLPQTDEELRLLGDLPTER